MYMKHHRLNNALKVFDEIPHKNIASFNVTIAGFCENGSFPEALRIFKRLGPNSILPNSITIASLLPASGVALDGMSLHCWAIKMGFDNDIYVSTSIVTMYFEFKDCVLATKAFEQIGDKNVVSYNAFISGLVQNGYPFRVLSVFNDMRQSLGEKLDSITLISILSACSDLSYLQFGRQIHSLALKTDIACDTMVGTALVDMYSKCGIWQWAYSYFKEMNGKRNLFTWNSMISGMMLNDQAEKAVALFREMESERLKPDSVTWNSIISGFSQLGMNIEAFKFFNKLQSLRIVPSLKLMTSLLPVCSGLSALRCGKEIHGFIIRNNFSTDEFISTALIDMYMKCGHSYSARRIFDQFHIKPPDPAFWNSMICGYSLHGEKECALIILNQMLENKVKPNSATLTGILSLCSHTGQLQKAESILKAMTTNCGLKVNAVHLSCMVDLLGRSGNLAEAQKLIKEIPKPPPSVFASLLGACECHLNSEIGEEMALQLSELEPENPIPFVILSNIYAGQGKWIDVARIREMMNKRGLIKLFGHSSIEVT